MYVVCITKYNTTWLGITYESNRYNNTVFVPLFITTLLTYIYVFGF